MTARHSQVKFSVVGCMLVTLSLLGFGCATRHSNILAASSTDLRLPSGFGATVIAHVDGARELTVAPNGDVFVGTKGSQIFVIPSAEDGGLRPAQAFTIIDDAPVAGVTLTKDAMYVGSQFGVWRVPYKTGDRTARAKPKKIAAVRTSGVSSDHLTTSVAYSHSSVFASVGSSCNVCDPELDATRATIARIAPDGGRMERKAIHIRNAIALTTNPNTGTVWAGVAGQDELQHGHPYEIFDAVTSHPGVADYGWPYCYDKRRATKPGYNCANVVVPRVVFPAYETPIGAAIYPVHPRNKHAFPSKYWGGAFVALHGSWHRPPVPPRVAFVPLRGDVPSTPVNWSNPGAQWSEFVGGYQSESGSRGGRPTGVAVGPAGDLFVADDYNGSIYRIRAVR